jgi:TetR/AcrR family transcriptional regulator
MYLIYFMSPPLQARLRGRPESGLQDHRERLMDCGRDLFAAAGYAATSLRQVALGAGVTPALAHYYFKDKAGLLQAIARERVAPLVNAIDAALAAQAPASALAGFVQQFTRVCSRHPWLPQLLLREMGDAGPAPVLCMLAARLRELVMAGQARGAIRSDLGAQSMVLSVLSLCMFPFLAGPALRQELGISAEASAAPGVTLHHLAVLQDGLKPRARNP